MQHNIYIEGLVLAGVHERTDSRVDGDILSKPPSQNVIFNEIVSLLEAGGLQIQITVFFVMQNAVKRNYPGCMQI